MLNKYFLGTKGKCINGHQEPEKKNLGWWGAVLKDNICLMLSPETPPVAFYRVGSAGPQAGRAVAAFSPPPTCSASPGPATEGRKLTFIEGLLWAAHYVGELTDFPQRAVMPSTLSRQENPAQRRGASRSRWPSQEASELGLRPRSTDSLQSPPHPGSPWAHSIPWIRNSMASGDTGPGVCHRQCPAPRRPYG